jgi:hypothetical protein
MKDAKVKDFSPQPSGLLPNFTFTRRAKKPRCGMIRDS